MATEIYRGWMVLIRRARSWEWQAHAVNPANPMQRVWTPIYEGKGAKAKALAEVKRLIDEREDPR